MNESSQVEETLVLKGRSESEPGTSGSSGTTPSRKLNSEILTSTPLKEKLQEAEDKKENGLKRKPQNTKEENPMKP
ncbi:hypothetical protein PR048_002622 [Dryococelus australis]|uniref:Uncharacterized protein n=1 Tax=Dryococelus australis TaxID=614101 RepID=A0ABQ9ILS2_9NEOP|nr:hypothetical protein PR048_002622 [Dryococelus australis]